MIGITKDGNPCKICMKRGRLCHLHTSQGHGSSNSRSKNVYAEEQYYYSHSPSTQYKETARHKSKSRTSGSKFSPHYDTAPEYTTSSYEFQAQPHQPKVQRSYPSASQQRVFGVTLKGTPCQRCLKQGNFCYQHKDQQPSSSSLPRNHYIPENTQSYYNSPAQSSSKVHEYCQPSAFSSQEVFGITQKGTPCKRCLNMQDYCYQHQDQRRSSSTSYRKETNVPKKPEYSKRHSDYGRRQSDGYSQSHYEENPSRHSPTQDYTFYSSYETQPQSPQRQPECRNSYRSHSPRSSRTPKGKQQQQQNNWQSTNDNMPSSRPSSFRNHRRSSSGPPANPASDPMSDKSIVKLKVESLKKDASSAYKENDYRLAIHLYTDAIELYEMKYLDQPQIYETSRVRSQFLPTPFDLAFASLLRSNRSAALFMVGAYDACAHDCRKALEGLPDDLSIFASAKSCKDKSSQSYCSLKPKLYCRLANAEIKLGQSTMAETHLEQANESVTFALAYVRYPPMKEEQMAQEQKLLSVQQQIQDCMKRLAQLDRRMKDVTFALKELARYESSPFKNSKTLKGVFDMVMNSIETAMAIATDDVSLWEQKIKALSTIQNFRLVARQCEVWSLRTLKSKDCFPKDLFYLRPYLEAGPVQYLQRNFFDRQDNMDPLQYAELKLPTLAVKEAILRMPLSVMPAYVRALRLEQRFDEAQSALNTLQQHIRQSMFINSSSWRWMQLEEKKLERTTFLWNSARSMKALSQFQQAVDTYRDCLNVDGVRNQADVDGEVGGLLHARLHANMAVCYEKLAQFNMAVMEYSRALGVHPMFMSALRRRARCYGLQKNVTESLRDFQQWLSLQEQARQTPKMVLECPCFYDLPTETTGDHRRQVLEELDRLLESNKQSWGSNCGGNYGGTSSSSSRPGNGSGAGFRSGPSHPMARHFFALGLPIGASKDDVKKSYMKLVRLYHPDKNQDPDAPAMFRKVQEAWEALRDTP